MTGQKDRYSTTEKLWKLDDEQLTTPKHDEMVLDILSNGKFLFANLTPTVDTLHVSYELYRYRRCPTGWIYSNTECRGSELNQKTITNLSSEFPDITSLWDANIVSIKNREPKVRSEVPLTAKNGFLVGFLDILLESDSIERKTFPLCTFEDTDNRYELIQIISDSKVSIGIEVKPEISSFGQTLRQLNTYREYFGGLLFLYTEDTRFSKAFESQGIKLISKSDLQGSVLE